MPRKAGADLIDIQSTGKRRWRNGEKTMINKGKKKKIKTRKEAGNIFDYNIECLNMRWAENKTGKVTHS